MMVRQKNMQMVIVNGDRHWYKNDKRHRDDGPAKEYANGDRKW